jgi:hypothetical protein
MAQERCSARPSRHAVRVALTPELLAWETVYNTGLHRQALGQLTPLGYLTIHFTEAV